MTNAQIIFNEALAHNIFTEDQAIAILEKSGSLPLHTFAGWKSLGYSVKKGEKAKITTRLWKFKRGRAQENNDTEEQDERNYYLCKAFLFTVEQVQRIEEAA